MSIQKRQQQIIEEFSSIDSWEDRYKKVIAIGKELPDIDPKLQVDDNKVKGCQSQVWLFAKLNDQGQVEYVADSDAMIVRGLVALLVRLYSHSQPKEILKTKPEFINALGFQSNLSQSRANGLNAMVKQIKYYAMAFASLNKVN